MVLDSPIGSHEAMGPSESIGNSINWPLENNFVNIFNLILVQNVLVSMFSFLESEIKSILISINLTF